MRKQFLTFCIIVLGLGLISYTTWYVFEKDSKGVTVIKYQIGNMTYLVFGNGSSVVNYTSDSMEYEFLHQPTKTLYGQDTSKTE